MIRISGKAYVYFWLVLDLAVIVSGAIYAFWGILGTVPVNLSIYFSWLGLHYIVTAVLVYVFWRNREKFGLQAKALMITWGGLVGWWYMPAAIYFILTMNLDVLQIKWMNFVWMWELAGVGGMLMGGLSFWLIKPISDFVEKQSKRFAPEQIYRKTFRYPTLMAFGIVAIATIGYAIATLQFRIFAFQPSIEQIKFLAHGFITSFSVAIFYLLVFRSLMSPVRVRIRSVWDVKYKTRHTFIYRIALLATMSALVVVALMSLAGIQSNQISIQETIKIGLSDRLSIADSRLNDADGFREAKITEALDIVQIGPSARSEIVTSPQDLSVNEFSPESIDSIFSNQSGVIDDFRAKVKIVGFLDLPDSKSKIISVVYAEDFYEPLIDGLTAFFYVAIFVILVSALINIDLIYQVTGSLGKIFKFVTSGGNRAIDIRSGDEIEDLAEKVSGAARIAEESETLLESKIIQKTKEYANKATSLELSQKALANLLEDLKISGEILEKRAVEDEAIISSIGDGLITLDKYGRVDKINRQMEELLGLNKEELIGRWLPEAVIFYDLKTGEPIKPENTLIAESILSGKPSSGIYLVYNRNLETKLSIAMTASPVSHEDKPIGVVIVARDVTKEQDVDRAKTEFVSLASHQLRTPLSAVKWYTEMLLAGDAGEINANQKKFLDEVYKGNERMIELVGALLDVSRLELGTFTIEQQEVSIIDIAKDLIKEMSQDIKMKELKFRQELDELPKYPLDKKLVRIIMQNLLSNAVKYTPKGGTVDFSITLSGLDGDKLVPGSEFIVVMVKDTGYGIPKKQQAKIFTKMFRADNVREKDTDGTGLGLYIVKSILMNVGGRVWFSSAENKGSVFYAAIPSAGMERRSGSKPLG